MPRARRNGKRNGRQNGDSKAPVRCAIYCRKSVAPGREETFTSLDAQQQSCEALIKSRQPQRWVLAEQRYHDSGFSGATIERPAFQKLLADVELGAIDVIVCYRLDRVSRSLIDFLKTWEFLEQHGVSIFSVTETIDSSTPHGRMMVNMLLGFAQYEREVIAERTRDKILAARRLGRWTGGLPRLGYDVAPEGGKLLVNSGEAEQVVAMFKLYMEKASLIDTARELNRRGWRTKSWTTKEGRPHLGKLWDKGNLYRLLRSPLYIGKITADDDIVDAEHEAIVPKKLYRETQRLLDANGDNGGAAKRNRTRALLRGMLFCSHCGAAMTHTFTGKKNRRYRYYRCSTAVKRGADACPTGSVSAQQIENVIVEQIRVVGRDEALQREVLRQARKQVAEQRTALRGEQRRVKREFVDAKREVEQLVAKVGKADGGAEAALMTALDEAQRRLQQLSRHAAELADELAILGNERVDEADLRSALESFAPIWDVLHTVERERVLRLLIAKITIDGTDVEIAFRPLGISTLAEERATDEAAS